MRAYSDTRERVARLLSEGLSLGEIAERLGIAKPTVCYHKRKLGYEMGSIYTRRYDWAEVQAFYDDGHSITECQERFGMARKTFADAVVRGDVVTRPQGASIEHVFAAGRRRNRGHLKQRLFRAGLKEPRCEKCGIEEWRGAALSLQLHHVNGDGNDNRLENLVLLCPNCHSQTENWGGRNVRRKAA
jgi:predicted DNA-binding protein YlxM (UPF0122 family)